jgi:hypothetical protein
MIIRDIIRMNPFKPVELEAAQANPGTATAEAAKLRPVDKFITNILGESMNDDNKASAPLKYMAWL